MLLLILCNGNNIKMIPIDQTILHDPDNGQYGDCQRACVASLLEIPIEEVPHFLETGIDADFNKKYGEFLESRNLFQLIINANSSYIFPVKCYHFIYGLTERGTLHGVIGLNGKMVHDPHPSRSGLLESDKDNWVFAFLVPTYQ